MSKGPFSEDKPGTCVAKLLNSLGCDLTPTLFPARPKLHQSLGSRLINAIPTNQLSVLHKVALNKYLFIDKLSTYGCRQKGLS